MSFLLCHVRGLGRVVFSLSRHSLVLTDSMRSRWRSRASSAPGPEPAERSQPGGDLPKVLSRVGRLSCPGRKHASSLLSGTGHEMVQRWTFSLANHHLA